MKEEHLALAYELALSDIPTENLCDEATFASKAPDVKLSFLEREMIGAEAISLRGNESYDWIEPGILVDFWTEDRYDRMSGTVQRISSRQVDGVVIGIVSIQIPNGTIQETYVYYCRRPRQ